MYSLEAIATISLNDMLFGLSSSNLSSIGSLVFDIDIDLIFAMGYVNSYPI